MTARGVVRKYLEQYETQGFVGPLRAFDAAVLQGTAEEVRREISQHKDSVQCKRNRHLDWPVAARLIESPAMAEVVAQILGPELVLWRTHFFMGHPGHGLGWHQDEYRTLLTDPLHHLSVHLAITAATPANCVMVLPGSHTLTHGELAERGFNLKPGGGTGTYGTFAFWRNPEQPVQAVKMLLQPGEYFIFHPRLLHASRDVTVPPGVAGKNIPHATGVSRIGFGLRITVPANKVLPAAFTETSRRGDHCVRLHF